MEREGFGIHDRRSPLGRQRLGPRDLRRPLRSIGTKVTIRADGPLPADRPYRVARCPLSLSDEEAAAYGRFGGPPPRAELERVFFRLLAISCG
jgi:hypothetical protein